MFTSYAVCGAFLILATSWDTPQTRVKEAWIALAILAGGMLALPLASNATGFMTHTVDNYLALADRATGLSTWPLAERTHSRFWLIETERMIYGSLPLAIAAGWVLERDWNLVKAAAIGAIVCPLLYLTFPAVGPAAAYPGFPINAPTVKPVIMAVMNHSLPRNAFPSMHFAWALMLFAYAHGKFWKIITLGYCLGMAVATMGSGEHYAFDLIASVFLVWGIEKARVKWMT